MLYNGGEIRTKDLYRIVDVAGAVLKTVIIHEMKWTKERISRILHTMTILVGKFQGRNIWHWNAKSAMVKGKLVEGAEAAATTDTATRRNGEAGAKGEVEAEVQAEVETEVVAEAEVMNHIIDEREPVADPRTDDGRTIYMTSSGRIRPIEMEKEDATKIIGLLHQRGLAARVVLRS